MKNRVQGKCHRMYLKERTEYDPLVIIEVEDDGHWHEKHTFDVAWLPEFYILLNELINLDDVKTVLTDIQKRKAKGTYYRG